ncbi:MAG: flagellar hook assembly protein FlgD [Alphaproteobacteria bacterium]
MSDINKVQDAQNALFDKLGIKTKAEADRATSNELGQEEFLRLMTAQLQNQDPFTPMENGDFIAQMAQFSTVDGINRMSTGLSDIASQIEQFRVAMATNLMGHDVLVPGNVGRVNADGELHGALELPQTALAVTLKFLDAESGELLETQELGGQAAGLVGFSWLDTPDLYRDGSKSILVEAIVDSGNGPESFSPALFAKVMGAEIGAEDGAIRLDVRDNGLVRVDEVKRFKI